MKYRNRHSKYRLILSLFFALSCSVNASIIINELDADTPSVDTEEFIELFDGGVGNTSLDGLVLVLYNGSDDQSEGGAIDLSGFNTDIDGYFVIGNADVAAADLIIANGRVQNGADAAALYQAASTDFPNDTPVTTDNLVDAIVYDTSDADDSGLLVLLNAGQPQVDENSNGERSFESSQRCANGAGGALNTANYIQATPTPGLANNCPNNNANPADLIINEVDADTAGSDVEEFIELFDGGVGNTPLNGFVVVLYNGSDNLSTGNAIDLTGFSTDQDGYFVIGNALVSGVDLVINNGSVQNGADAVALYQGVLASDFPNDTAITLDNLVDAIVYDTNDADDAELLVLLNAGQPQVNEGGNGSSAADSNQRCANGTGGARNTETYLQATPTPGATNNCGNNNGGGNEAGLELRIFEIQGMQQQTAFEGQLASNVPGIVTAIANNGFYLQDPEGDNNRLTSDALFVFTGSTPTVQVGDVIQVSGTITEFGFTGGLTTTQLAGPGLNIVASPNAFNGLTVTPTVIGNVVGGLLPPDQIIDNDFFAIFDPEEDGIDFFESLEAMLVTVDNPQVAAATNRFGEVVVLASAGAGASGINARGGITISEITETTFDFNPERIQVDDSLFNGNMPTFSTGDILDNITGVIGYSFGNFEVLPSVAPAVVSPAGPVNEVTALVSDADHLTVASYNVLNLGADELGSGRFAAIADQLVNNLNSPDIIALQEVQDNNGSTGVNDGVVEAEQTYQGFIDAIQAIGGPRYEFSQIDPAEGLEGGIPGGNIRVGYLFNPARVSLANSQLGQGSAFDNTTPSLVGNDIQLSFNPGRIEPTSDFWEATRRPLAAEFIFNGQSVFVINVHFSSKGGSDSLFGSIQPPANGREDRRNGQASLVNNFVDSLLALDAQANVVILGDFNEFDFFDPLKVLRGELELANPTDGTSVTVSNEAEILTNLATQQLPVFERYSFEFQGNSQELDHVFTSDNLSNNAAPEIDILHVNVGISDSASDHDPSVARFLLPAEQAEDQRVTRLRERIERIETRIEDLRPRVTNFKQLKRLIRLEIRVFFLRLELARLLG